MEVTISAREVATAYRETQARAQSVNAFNEDLSTIEARRSVLLTNGSNEIQVSDYLDRLLDAQDRRANSEEEFIRSAANYQIAIVNLERAKGKLLSYSDVQIVRTKDEKGLPLLYLQKGGHDAKEMRSFKN
jgi:outer membrane protein TolC